MAAPNNSKTVWVLGAGFSQPLGGPLLPDLFRYEDHHDLERQFPDSAFSDLAAQMFWTKVLFNWGRDAERRWENGEQFLSYLDDAFLPSGSVKKDIIRGMCDRMKMLPPGKNAYVDLIGYRSDVLNVLKDLAQHCARRTLAAECHRFLIDSDRGSELWRPYREWADGLSPEFDTVLTFNYDLVPDRLDRLMSVLPSEAAARPRSKVPVLKLHGSVDWIHSAKSCSRISATDILANPNEAIAIASPGRAKGPSVNDLFTPLWRWW